MSRAIFILPWVSGDVSYPGLTASEKLAVIGYCAASYVPPHPTWAQYVLAFINTTDAIITTLTNQSNALYICNIAADDTYVAAPLAPTQRNDIRAKIAAMGFTGSQYGLINAAVQSSQHRGELAFNLASAAFMRHVDGTKMTNHDLQGTIVAS